MTQKERRALERKRLSYSTVKERQAKQDDRQSRLSQWEAARRTLNTNEARRRVVERARSGEFWTILFSQQSALFFLHLVEKYYSDPLSDEDATACVVTCESLAPHGIEFLVASFRRRRMLAPVLKREFAEMFDTDYTERDMVACLSILAVEPQMFKPAIHAAEHLFEVEAQKTKETM